MNAQRGTAFVFLPSRLPRGEGMVLLNRFIRALVMRFAKAFVRLEA